MRLNDLQPGDWFEMKYGYQRRWFYVLSVTPTSVRFCRSQWLVSCAETMSHEMLLTHEPTYLGRGRRRWLSFVFRDLMCPYTKPRRPHGEALTPDKVMVVAEEWPEYLPHGWM